MMCKPFLKWVGGKTQLLPTLSELLPSAITKYCEPFIGGGAMLFYLLNTYNLQEVLINDTNSDLIITYLVIKHDVNRLIQILSKVESKYLKLNENLRSLFYYTVREQFNNEILNYGTYSDAWVKRAAQLIFLNKTCFNGLYRVNKSGKFNSPHGDYKNPTICDSENLKVVNQKLQIVEMKIGNYQNCIDWIDNNTFVYLDPPYIPVSKFAKFNSYSKDGWGLEDDNNLIDWLHKLNALGAKIMLSSSHASDWSKTGFRQLEITARRNVSSKVESRQGTTELVVINYSIPH